MDFKEIKELIRVFDKSELNKLKVKDGDFEIALQKGFEATTITSAPVTTAPIVSAPVQDTVAAPVSSATPAEASTASGEKINSPMVGTFYAAPSPEASAFVKVGDTVKAGQTLCILEAMKIMNEVEAEFDCKIVEILAKDSEPVEYDMPLFIVERI